MKYISIHPEGYFELEGRRWFCNSAVYYGRFPGTCSGDWLGDSCWEKNRQDLPYDFEAMSRVGINHTPIFLQNDSLFEAGRPVEKTLERLDSIVALAKRHGIRVSLFTAGFIDTASAYQRVTGEPWEDDDRWLPSFNPRLHAAYVRQVAMLAERYANEPSVLGYTDRIDRFHKGFDNKTIPHNLKEEWAEWLKNRYGSLDALREAVGGKLEGGPCDFHQVLLPQESAMGASLSNPLAYDYILMQKSTIGEAHSRFDAEIRKIAPNQIVWTPFEGNTITWAMLDGFSPETKRLQAIWMEYYFFGVTNPSLVQPFEEWVHTREICHHRPSYTLPVVQLGAYYMTRYLKKSVQQPVVICHGAMVDAPAWGASDTRQQAALVDRVNAACLAADGDGWHYWNWRDDNASSSAHLKERNLNPLTPYNYGESMGLLDFDGRPRPVCSVARRYTDELYRRTTSFKAPRTSDVLLLNSAPRLYSLFRRLAFPTAAAVCGAMQRLGVEPDVLWTAQNDEQITQETLDTYRFIVIGDNMYGRDFREMPEKLLRYVEQGGTLYFSLESAENFEDEHGVKFTDPAWSLLCGVNPNGTKQWPGATQTCPNWPYPTDAAVEPNLDANVFPRVSWALCPDFEIHGLDVHAMTFLGFRSLDGDVMTLIPGLVKEAEVIAIAKYPSGALPLFYRHPVGKGWVYVNAWTNNVFRDSESRHDYGGSEFDWMLSIPLQSSGAEGVDITRGQAQWLRNTWGYFWREL